MVASKKKLLRTIPEMEALAREYIADWASFTGVDHQWTIHIYFVPAKEMESEDSFAECNWPTSYTTATIKFNTDNFKKKQPCNCEIEEASVHEIGHLVDCLIWDWAWTNLAGPVRKQMTDLLERQCDVWTRIVIRARYGDEYRCYRCSELHGSDNPSISEPTEGLRSEEGDSGWQLREYSPTAVGSFPS